MNIADLRKSYEKAELSEDASAADPLKQFERWLNEAIQSASGCSIDASVHFIQSLEKELGLSLLDKMNVTFRDNDRINSVKLFNFQQFVKENKVTPETIVFDNMVTTKAAFERHWEVPAKESWHKRFLV